MKDSRYYLIQETKNTSRNQFIPPHLLTAFSFVSMCSSTGPGKRSSSGAPASNLLKLKSNETEHTFLPSILCQRLTVGLTGSHAQPSVNPISGVTQCSDSPCGSLPFTCGFSTELGKQLKEVGGNCCLK